MAIHNLDNQGGTSAKIRSLVSSIPLKLFFGTFLVYLFCNNGIDWDSASERTRYAQIKAIIEGNVFYIDRFIPSFPHPQLWDLSLPPNGHYYPNKPPGLTFLGVPVVYITSVLRIPYPLDGFILILLTCCFTSATVVLLYSLCIRSFGMSEKVSLLVSLIYSFATFAFPHAVTLYSNSFSAFFVFSVVYLLVSQNKKEEGKNQITRLLVSGIMAGYLPLLDYSNVLLFLPFLLYIFFSKNRRYIGIFLLPVTLWLVVLLTYHYVCFGDPFITSYGYAINTRNTFDWGYTRPLHLGLLRFLFTPRRGIFIYSPVLIFSIFGFYVMLKDKQDRKEGVLFLSSFLIILFFFSALAYSSGWVFGSRRLDPVLPLLCIPIGRVLQSPKKVFFSKNTLTNSFLEKNGTKLFWFAFSALFLLSIVINGLGAITDVHPMNLEYLDHNINLFLNGQIHSLIWNISPLLGLIILLPAIMINVYALYKTSKRREE